MLLNFDCFEIEVDDMRRASEHPALIIDSDGPRVEHRDWEYPLGWEDWSDAAFLLAHQDRIDITRLRYLERGKR